MAIAKNKETQGAASAAREERALDATRARREYEAERLALLARTERLRALRLANAAPKTPDTRKRASGRKLAAS
jgi:hypothetical protein